MKAKLGLMTSMLLVAGCTSITEVNRFSHGYAPTATEVANIKSSGANKDTIAQKFGKPFVIGTYNPDYWYYIAYSTKQYGFSKREFTKFTIVEMNFRNGVLVKTNRYDKSNLKKIAFSDDKTKTSGKELGILEQMLGNIGKFRPKPKE